MSLLLRRMLKTFLTNPNHKSSVTFRLEEVGRQLISLLSSRETGVCRKLEPGKEDPETWSSLSVHQFTSTPTQTLSSSHPISVTVITP